MTISLSPEAAIAAVNAVTETVMYGTEEPSPQIIVFSGVAPARSAAIDPEVNAMLVSFGVPDTGFGAATAVDGAAESLLVSVPAVDAVGAGDAAFFRVYDRNGAVVMQGSVGESGSPDNSPMLLNQKTITVGASVSIYRFVVGMGIG